MISCLLNGFFPFDIQNLCRNEFQFDVAKGSFLATWRYLFASINDIDFAKLDCILQQECLLINEGASGSDEFIEYVLKSVRAVQLRAL